MLELYLIICTKFGNNSVLRIGNVSTQKQELNIMIYTETEALNHGLL